MFDIDMDGIRDVLVTTFDGEVVFFKDNVSTTEGPGAWLCMLQCGNWWPVGMGAGMPQRFFWDTTYTWQAMAW